MIVDTSVLLAYFDADEPRHADVTKVLESTDSLRVISPYVVAELDYLVMTRFGVRVEREVLRELAGGAWELAAMSVERVAAALAVAERFADQSIGVADASNIVLAHAYGTQQIATLDRRRFSFLRLADGSAPVIVP